MTSDEWSARWKRNDDLPGCLRCGSTHTKEHHFTQTWYASKLPAGKAQDNTPCALLFLISQVQTEEEVGERAAVLGLPRLFMEKLR